MKKKWRYRFLAGCAIAFFLWLSTPVHGAIPNFHEVEEGFFRGGQPEGEEDITSLRTLGFQTIVSFREDKSVIRWESELVEKNGMTFISIPLNWKRTPTNEEVRTFLNGVSQPERRPVFVHCREGRDRTGAMVALYRIVVQGTPVQEAYEEATRLGFREGASSLREFILWKTATYRELPLEEPFDFPDIMGVVLFYTFECAIFLLSVVSAVTCLRKPDLAIRIQKKFYTWINWDVEPISMKKELRNTRVLGGILLFVSFVLLTTFFLFSI